MSPRPSSPTVPTNVTVPAVWIDDRASALAIATMTASPRASSPMPGPFSTVPVRVTRTSVPSGNTVSRCALMTTCGRAARAAPHAEHVADGVEAHVAEAGGDEALAERLGARGFLERRRRDLGERHLVVEDRRLAGLQRVDCRDHVGAGEQATGRVVVDPRRRRLDRERQRESQRDGDDAKHHDQ